MAQQFAQRGLLKNRPAAGRDVNHYYQAEDEAGGTLYRWTGTTWAAVVPGAVMVALADYAKTADLQARTPSGTATVASGDTSVTVTHGYGANPGAANIHVTPTNNLGLAAKFWVSNVGASTFRINVDADPGAGTATFAWQVIKV